MSHYLQQSLAVIAICAENIATKSSQYWIAAARHNNQIIAPAVVEHQ
jgi:hypothetical protein